MANFNVLASFQMKQPNERTTEQTNNRKTPFNIMKNFDCLEDQLDAILKKVAKTPARKKIAKRKLVKTTNMPIQSKMNSLTSEYNINPRHDAISLFCRYQFSYL